MKFQLELGVDTSSEKKLARETFQPSQPIRTQEALVGRSDALARTLDALGTPGRSPFIFGARGVGKTSLAQTAAYLHNWSGSEPIYVACVPDLTFAHLMTRISRKLIGMPYYQQTKKKTKELKVGPSILQYVHRVEQSEELPAGIDIADAVELLNSLLVGQVHNVVVIVDELDEANNDLKRALAYLIKQIGDQQARIDFIFAGIADSPNELLTHHASAAT